jgi:hypothetical protein
MRAETLEDQAPPSKETPEQVEEKILEEILNRDKDVQVEVGVDGDTVGVEVKIKL